MVPPSQALVRAFALADAASDEYEMRTAAHALYYALLHYAGEALESKTDGLNRRFYWNELRPNGHPAQKTHKYLQEGWVRYLDGYTNANNGDHVYRLLRRAHKQRQAADYQYRSDFTRAKLDELLDSVQQLVPIIDDTEFALPPA